MDDNGESRIAQRHVAELSVIFATQDQWVFGHACARTRGDRELGLAEGTVHGQLHTARGRLVAGLERYYPFGRDNGKGAAS
jgi:hypothetical protein